MHERDLFALLVVEVRHRCGLAIRVVLEVDEEPRIMELRGELVSPHKPVLAVEDAGGPQYAGIHVAPGPALVGVVFLHGGDKEGVLRIGYNPASLHHQGLRPDAASGHREVESVRMVLILVLLDVYRLSVIFGPAVFKVGEIASEFGNGLAQMMGRHLCGHEGADKGSKNG